MNSNLGYLDPFRERQPEQQTASMTLPSEATCMAISPHGFWLAVGHREGLISLWSLESKQLCWQRRLGGGPIVKLSWTEELVAIIGNEIHLPLSDRMVSEGRDQLLWAGHETGGALLTVSTKEVRRDGEIIHVCHDDDEISAVCLAGEQQQQQQLWLGTVKGHLHRLPDGLSLTTSAPIQTISVNPKDPLHQLLVIPLNERAIRVYSQDRLLVKLSDAVEKWPWQTAGYSADGEIIYGLVQTKGKHLLYLWAAATPTGKVSLLRQLEGAHHQQACLDAQWHPNRPCLITLSTWQITLFTPLYPPRWIAMVPGLEEVEQNRVYQEREDEFDIMQVEAEQQKPVIETDLGDLMQSPLTPAEIAEQSLLSRLLPLPAE